MHTSVDWTDLLVEAGARPCRRCGKHASIPARLAQSEREASEPDLVADNTGAIWICFECGHEDRRGAWSG